MIDHIQNLVTYGILTLKQPFLNHLHDKEEREVEEQRGTASNMVQMNTDRKIRCFVSSKHLVFPQYDL